jgi:carbonic anhydrase
VPNRSRSADDALARLVEGNRRFVESRSSGTLVDHARRIELVAGQEPFAVVLGCSDSRVPAELVFDQGFGDLFVIRVAGNIVAPSQIGSVEFAASVFGTRLVVVMGHSLCGPVVATLEAALGRETPQSRNLKSIVDRIRPAVEGVIAGRRDAAFDTLLSDAVRANVHASVEMMRHGSPLLEELIGSEGLRIVGAEYSLETGVVEFLDAVPQRS